MDAEATNKTVSAGGKNPTRDLLQRLWKVGIGYGVVALIAIVFCIVKAELKETKSIEKKEKEEKEAKKKDKTDSEKKKTSIAALDLGNKPGKLI